MGSTQSLEGGDDRHSVRQSLHGSMQTVRAWEPEAPEPGALRCEFSRHRTLAHLRACQEQWLIVVRAFAERDHPSVTILHPWRKFTSEHYELIPWGDHMAQYIKGRALWLALLESADWSRGGKMNRKPETIGSLARRLAQHEAYHIAALEARMKKGRKV